MLSIKTRKEFQQIYEQHHTLNSDFFRALCQKITEDNFYLGIVISKKVGKAVIRNKIKRRIRAFMRENETLIPTGQKIVLIAKPSAATADWIQLKNDLNKLLINNEISE